MMLMQSLGELREKNDLLFYFGLVTLVGGLICLLLMNITQTQVMGVSAYLKPMKFFLSVWILVWTLGIYMQYLDNQSAVRVFSMVATIGLSYELLIIFGQAARGRLSHFNVSTPMDSLLFSSMALVIILVVLHMLYIGSLFFVQQKFSIPMHLVWAIRLAILVAVVFSFQGMLMGSRLQHTVGAPDGGVGLSVVNWSKSHGDLRISHFFGIHALQIIPLAAYFISKNVIHTILIVAVYTGFVVFTLIQALSGKPLIP